jgi:HEAT repeat protein
MTKDDFRRISHALLHPETVSAAVDALRGRSEKAAVEGLVEHIGTATQARTAIAAIAALEGCSAAIVLDGLRVALGSPHASVRLTAVQAVQQRTPGLLLEDLVRLVRQDASRLVRSAAVEALAECPGEERWQVLVVATDPHWRVRHALLRVLVRWSEAGVERREIEERLAGLGDGDRVRGLRAYLAYRWTGREPEASELTEPAPAVPTGPVWDWDAAVLHRNLERLGASGRREALEKMPALLIHADDRVSGLALDTLRQGGRPPHLATAIALLDDPRLGSAEPVGRLLGYLDLDRAEEVALYLFGLPSAVPAQLAWAVDQVEVSLSAADVAERLASLLEHPSEQPALVRRALARLLGRWPHPESAGHLQTLLADEDGEVQAELLRLLKGLPQVTIPAGTLKRLLESPIAAARIEATRAALRQGEGDLREQAAADPDARVRQALAQGLAARAGEASAGLLARLQHDPHPYVRAAALTPALAEQLVAEPDRETSWHVLGKAADLMRVPFWRLAPEPEWRPEGRPVVVAPALSMQRLEPPEPRLLGPDRLEVARVGISGHYGLPVEGFVRAVESGVNLLFWEPNYQTLTTFAGRLTRGERGGLHFLVGTFEATGRRVQRDVEHALRTLQIERISLFLLFWVQSWERISDDVRESLERLKASGKIGMYSLSTHVRPLALEAMAAGWNPVMVRHSAAHRGAEAEVFPRALQTGTSLITFNNTCYGRLLKPQDGLVPASAADCYRYTLSQSAVTLCMSAPATQEQLEENLQALRDPELPAERREHLLAVGERVYREDTLFRKLVRAR